MWLGIGITIAVILLILVLIAVWEVWCKVDNAQAEYKALQARIAEIRSDFIMIEQMFKMLSYEKHPPMRYVEENLGVVQ